MTATHRSRLVPAVIAAAILMSLLATTANAGVPHARRYHVGGPITLDTNLRSRSGATAWAIDEYLAANTPLPPLGAAFIAAERKHGVNARFLLAAALHESGWGRSYISRVKHNLFGLNAYDRDPLRYASAHASYGASIRATAKFIKASYLTPGGRWWGGQPTLRSMQRYWSSSGRWGEAVSRIASSLHLRSLAGRKLRFAAPVLSGPLHGGDRASVRLSWSGGAIPAGVEFQATWRPIELDEEVVAAAIADAATAEVGALDLGAIDTMAMSASRAAAVSLSSVALPPTVTPRRSPPSTVAARRIQTKDRSIILAVPAPDEPGRYTLELELRDAGRGPLPARERVDIPGVEVRVFDDRAVTYDIDPSPDGAGAVLRITNTGRVTIPAAPEPAPFGSNGSRDEAVRSVVTVTAAAGPSADPRPVHLLASPIVADLAPGASISLVIPHLDVVTGRTTNWISVGLSVVGDARWLAASSSDGAWLSTVRPLATGTPTPSPTPTPSATPVPTPRATPTPTPAPVATPRPSTAPQPTARPTAAPSAKPVTRTYSEQSGKIRYRGGWHSAPYPGYIGGRVTWSTSPGASASFTFTGSSVRWIGPLGPTRGLALVLVDGRAVARVNLHRSTFVARAVLFARTFRHAGKHTVTIKVLSSPGHPYVAIDAFTVRS